MAHAHPMLSGGRRGLLWWALALWAGAFLLTVAVAHAEVAGPRGALATRAATASAPYQYAAQVLAAVAVALLLRWWFGRRRRGQA